ncbi:MAG: hypothetical protein HYU65_00770, partial [Armatimonadetes bacterium]|nr:hypothetical protein [Armatimonadota bacterium]
ADAGFARAVSELSSNLAWPGTGGPVAEGDGTYDVTLASSGSTRFITSTGSRGGGRQILRGSLKAVPRRGMNTIFANTTATLGAATTGLTVGNTMPSPDATAVHANNRLGAGTAMTINTAGAVVIGGLTSNGPISGVLCASWPWRCDPAFGTIPLPQINVDAGPSSLKARAQSTFDAGKSLYFRGGDTSPGGCKNAPGYNFGLGQTQRCWDKYVSDHGGIIGTTIQNAVFFIEFNANERTRYTQPTLAITFVGALGGRNTGTSTLSIDRPGGVTTNDVMIAAISVRGGSTTTITPPAGWTLVNTIDNGMTIRMAIYYKVAAASEPQSYTWTFSSSHGASGGIQAYRDVDTAAPIDDEAGVAGTTGAGGTIATPSIITTIPNTQLVASFAVARGTSFTAPPGMTERYDINSVGDPVPDRTTSEGADALQAADGATGARTATAEAGAGIPGVAHLLALRPGGPTIDCVGYATAVETFCIRSRTATDSNNAIVYANSDLRQVSGTIVSFRRGTGTNVSGTIVMENLSLKTTNYSHASLSGDPALVAGGRVEVISSGSAAAQRTVDIIGIVYTFAGQDNPDVNGNLVGSSGVGIDVQHGADLVTLTFHGFLISNGSIAVQDTATNSGVVSVLYDSAVADALPAPFTASSTDNVIFSISWSSGD